MPHFQLVTTDGDALGVRELAQGEWPPGSLIDTRPSEPTLRVVEELATSDDDLEMHFRVLVVEAVGDEC